MNKLSKFADCRSYHRGRYYCEDVVGWVEMLAEVFNSAR
jgi:hypothetical protein